MGWKIESVQIEGDGGAVRPFNYIYTLPQASNTRPASYRGDGLLLGSGTVRLNREQQIMHAAQQHGVDPQELIRGISAHVASELDNGREVMRAV
ncbi:MAG: hypothetical protein R3F46_05765 [bacterium]